ncbi:MAG: Rieske 2Fe-2S domain-containing protein [Roseovarius sp.]|nr:Rieske 2Fe-2S domain-containing protein [Roseovarius sp.]
MERNLELALLEELQGLKNNGYFFLDDSVAPSPIERYGCDRRFEAEKREIFRREPIVAAHATEMPESGGFITREIADLPVLLTRDKEGEVHAFINVCRHRGARLVGENSGCKHSFSCPYHAWTWSNTGTLKGIPHEKPGFPGIDRSQYALRRLPATERHGLIWMVANPDAHADFEAYLAPLDKDFSWMGMSEMGIAHSEIILKNANWKLLVEGGIEAYHFKVAHRDTIGPHFLDNLSSYQMLGPHMRSVLPRTSLPSLDSIPRDKWSIRENANIVYTVFPGDQFLVMRDHVGWMSFRPLSAGKTEIRLTTLAPKKQITPEKQSHWERNHKISRITLGEDFEINEAVQSGIASGANDSLTFGRYEGALAKFNGVVETRLGI